MFVKEHIECDICGKTLPDDEAFQLPTVDVPVRYGLLKYTLHEGTDRNTLDICLVCSKKIADFIETLKHQKGN